MSLLPIRLAAGALAGAFVAIGANPFSKHANAHRSQTMTRTRVTAIAASLAFICATTDAFAHAQLEKATPAVGGTVSPPSEIRLEFSEGVEPKFTKVTLTGPGGVVPLGAGNTESGNQACADRADLQTSARRGLQGSLAGGLCRHAPYAGNF